MKILLDTNILVHNANRVDSRHRIVAAFLQKLVQDGAELCIANQSLYEFWVVASRPINVNGLGLSAADTRRIIDLLVSAFSLQPDPSELLPRWLDVCTQYQVAGRPAHDARLVAWMNCLGVTTIVTLNPADFARYDEIQCLVPVVR